MQVLFDNYINKDIRTDGEFDILTRCRENVRIAVTATLK